MCTTPYRPLYRFTDDQMALLREKEPVRFGVPVNVLAHANLFANDPELNDP